MRTGWIISITLHALAILVGFFVVPYDADRLRDLDRTTTVSLVSAPAPLADREQAPEVQEIDLASIAAPSFNADAGPAPDQDAAPVMSESDIIEDPSARDTEADLSALTEEVAQPEVSVRVDAPVESAPEPAMPSMALPGVSGFDSRTESPRGPQLATPEAPQQAPRISSFTAPPPPKPARPAETETAATTETPEERPEEVQPTEEAAVPEETTTAPSPDPESGQQDGLALRRSTAPKARPRDFENQIAEAVAAALREEQERQEAAERAEAERVAAAAAAATAAATPTPTPAPAATPSEAPAAEAAAAQPAARPEVPVGPPLTAGEKEGLKVAVERCWNVPTGLEGDSDLRVVVSVELDPNGRIIGQPRLIEPSSIGSREIQIAFEAARRALLRCQGDGYDLPREKYEHWKNLEVGFNPKGMLERW